MAKDQFMDTSAAAQYLHLTTRRVAGLCSTGKLQGAVRNGKKWMIPEESVIGYAEKNPGKHNEKAKELLPFAVGNTSFPTVVKECYYVDKTMLIKELIDDHNMVTLFTRPRRFGKTLMMSMLKAFFEISDENTSSYFSGMQIWTCGNKYRKMQAKYPVIFLTFKDVKFNSWDECLESIKIIVRDEYRRHDELKKSESLDRVDLDYYDRMINGTLSDVEYSRALYNLATMLYKHYHEKTVILIDEYDTPIQQGFVREFYNDVISFMRNFLSSGLKDNDYLAFGVLTGILRISKENLFSGLNNLAVNTVLDEKYSQYFGFTEEEVREMAKYYNKEDKLDEIRTWYDGYRFGNAAIYNPWSVASYFSNGCSPKNFWVNTSDNEILQSLVRTLTPEMAEELLSLIQGNSTYTSVNTEVIYPQIADGPDAIFSFLLLVGYLTPAGELRETDVGTYADLKLPNLEIRRVYNSEILFWVKDAVGVNAVTQIEKALSKNDAAMLQDAVGGYMRSCISVFDGSSEGFYHGMVLGLVASLSSRYYIRSNRESGDGRFDLQLEPRNHVLPGILMEFKSIRSAEGLGKEAEKAIKQIDSKGYKTDLIERGFKNIVCYGIAFSGKNVEVRVES